MLGSASLILCENSVSTAGLPDFPPEAGPGHHSLCPTVSQHSLQSYQWQGTPFPHPLWHPARGEHCYWWAWGPWGNQTQSQRWTRCWDWGQGWRGARYLYRGHLCFFCAKHSLDVLGQTCPEEFIGYFSQFQLSEQNLPFSDLQRSFLKVHVELLNVSGSTSVHEPWINRVLLKLILCFSRFCWAITFIYCINWFSVVVWFP